MPFTSKISDKELIIDHTNERLVTDPVKIDGDLKSRGLMKRDYARHPFASGPTVPSTVPLIPEDEWKDRAEFLEAHKSRLTDLCDAVNLPVKDQNGTNYCWVNAPVHCMEVIRAVQNKEFVSLSPASVGGPIKNYKNVGGWGSEALERIISHGVMPSKICGDNNYKCANLQTAENLAIAAKYKAVEWYDLPARSWEHLISCLLQLIPVAIGLDWWGHEVTAMDVVILPSGLLAVRIDNSWGREWSDNGRGILTREKALPDDAVAPRVAA